MWRHKDLSCSAIDKFEYVHLYESLEESLLFPDPFCNASFSCKFEFRSLIVHLILYCRVLNYLVLKYSFLHTYSLVLLKTQFSQ